MDTQVVVMGSVFCSPPIFRISCSSFRLWIMDPEHKNSMALKKACVQIWKKAKWGMFNPIATTIRPSWLDVEKAIIFLISFCVRAHIAANAVEIAPKHKQVVKAVWLSLIIGWIRIKRKTPATTIVLECRRADTGVGPSIADASQGWSPNWADLLAAAIIKAIRRGVGLCIEKMKFKSIESYEEISQKSENKNPMSPIRLYKTAWRAAAPALLRVKYQPIKR